MKKLSVILAISLVLALALSACAPQTPVSTDPPVTTDPSETAAPNTGLEPGTVFNSVDDFNYEAGQEGPWQYYFSGDSGKTYDPCGSFDDYGGVKGWHPWEGSYTGVGFNSDMEGFLELNTDCYSEDYSGQMGTLAFEAPADGKYVLTAAVWNPWEQPCGVFTFQHSDGTILYEQDMTELVDIYGYITPTDVELKAGDRIYMYCNATGSDWVSAYINATIYYEPTDDACYQVPEVEAPAPVVEIIPDIEDAAHSATAEFSKEDANGLWVYAVTTDGKEYTVLEDFREPTDWDDDEDVDASQWYSANGTGLGFNCDVNGWLEANVSNSVENGGEMTALGFKAPEAGTYKLIIFTQNKWGQDGGSVVLSVNGEDVATVDFLESVTVQDVEVTLEAGEIVYIHGTSNNDWVSAYIAVFVL